MRTVSPPSKFLLAALLPCVMAPFTCLRAAPASVEDILARASQWTVAIQVEREKDLPSSPFQPRRISPEGRAYYRRPAGFVSGILLDVEGNILTSFYNVAGEVKSLRVKLPGGDSRGAKLVARSVQDDIALLRLDPAPGEKAMDFTPPEWRTEPLLPGQFLLAAGRSPDPSRMTATRGIVSAATRNGGRAIQTDAELNYGNAGGPILDLDGRIAAVAAFVGHTQPQWGINSGVGFGTRSNAILEILPRLRAGEDVTAFEPAFLGVQCERDGAGEGGAKVERVVAGSGADRAGVLVNDVIVQLNGIDLHSFDHLRRLIFTMKPKETVKIRVRRGEKVLELEPTLGGPPRTVEP